jgi:GntR family transcriptional regulator, transcriptional repressor for pyruvate dehydrogenase complex
MASTLKSSDSRRLYQQVADQIRAVIEQGGFAPGSRLPPERELALQLGVSRPSLREALIALEIQGRVEIRMSSGVYVCAAPPASGSEALALGESPSELMQARSVLEGSIVSLAAARATKQGLDRLRSCLEAMRLDLLRGHAPVETDRRFHVTIAELTGNSILARLVGELFDGRQSPISSRLTRRAESERTWQAALHEHELILHAIESRDPQDATAAMSAHLKASRERWVGESGASAADRRR